MSKRGRNTWFSRLFGFDESGDFAADRAKFRMDGDSLVCDSSPHAPLHVGPWETPSVAELRERYAMTTSSGTLTFSHLASARGVEPLIANPSNAGAVFMVASQFNTLEMISPERSPHDGITIYALDKTQGPVCAMACPAATVFRNYLCQGGVGQGDVQIDLLADVGRVVGNEIDQHGRGKYWSMMNGYALPSATNNFRALGARLRAEPELCAAVEGALRVGIHAETQVHPGDDTPPCTHRVAQVFCSALPVAYARGRGLEAADWEPLAGAVLRGAYEATLAFAACRAAVGAAAGAAEDGQPAHEAASAAGARRVLVYLTAIGDGAFGNETEWVRDALCAALHKFRDAPLDVHLVHYGTTVSERWRGANVPGAPPAEIIVLDPSAEARERASHVGLMASIATRRQQQEQEQELADGPSANGALSDDQLREMGLIP